MKFWKKFKIKFNKNKRFRMWTIVTLILGIATLISGFIANVQKENYDETKSNADKIDNNKFKKQILDSTKETEFNTSSDRFFRENDFSRYSSYFKYGYIVFQQNENIKKPYKKTFGRKVYTDFSEFYISKKENVFYYNYFYELAEGLPHGMKIKANWEASIIDINKTNTPIPLQGLSIPYSDDIGLINAIIIIKNTKPYVYAIGLIPFQQQKLFN